MNEFFYNSQTIPWLSQNKNGLWCLAIHAQPGAKKSVIIGNYGDRLKISLQAPPVDGKANLILIKMLSNILKIPKKQIIIVSGDCSRDKRLEISGLNKIEILDKIFSQIKN